MKTAHQRVVMHRIRMYHRPVNVMPTVNVIPINRKCNTNQP